MTKWHLQTTESHRPIDRIHSLNTMRESFCETEGHRSLIGRAISLYNPGFLFHKDHSVILRSVVEPPCSVWTKPGKMNRFLIYTSHRNHAGEYFLQCTLEFLIVIIIYIRRKLQNMRHYYYMYAGVANPVNFVIHPLCKNFW